MGIGGASLRNKQGRTQEGICTSGCELMGRNEPEQTICALDKREIVLPMMIQGRNYIARQ